jgi:hypothetical protein
MAHASGFTVAAVVEYCGTEERRGDETVDAVRRLLFDEVAAGSLTVGYVFSCPSCGNVIDSRAELPEAPFSVYCEHPSCASERTVDPASALAVFRNTSDDPSLESWI